METHNIPASPVLGLGNIGSSRRAAVSLSDLRTPLVENIMSMLPTGHDKAFKYALYNVIALILAAFCVAAFIAAYCILEPFIKPLLWALLFGSVIHPFKDRLVTFTKEWLGMVKDSPTPLSIQLTFIPFRAVDTFSESIGTQVVTWWKYIICGSGGFFLTYFVYHNPPVSLGLIVYWILAFVFQTIVWIISWINGQFVLAMSAVYVGAVFHFTYARKVVPEPAKVDADVKSEPIDESDQARKEKAPSPEIQDRLMIRSLSVAVWSLWFIYFCRLLPYTLMIIVVVSVITGTLVYLQKQSVKIQSTVPVLTKYAQILTLIGRRPGGSVSSSRGVSRKASIQFRSRKNTHLTTPSPGDHTNVGKFTATPKESDKTLVDGDTRKLPQKDSPDLQFLDIEKTKKPEDLKLDELKQSGESHRYYSEESFPSPINSTFSEDEVDGALDSNKFLYAVLCACVIVQLWNRLWLVHLLPIPVVYFGIKKLCHSFGIVEYLRKSISQPFIDFYSSPHGPSRDLFPQPVRVFFHIIYEADRKFISIFESYLDMVATILILVAVMVVSVIILIFVATQFYAEGDHLVRVGANVINSTVSQYPEISKLLPEGWESLTGSLVGNAYHYGRDYIKTMIRDSVAEKDPERGEQMEKQVIELWDRIYLSWNRTWGSFDTIDTEAKGLEWNDFVKTGQNVTIWFDTSTLVNYAKANIGGLKAVLESLWTVLIGNVSLALSATTSVLSVVFGGGTAILNLIINFVVFLTALFYLLSASSSVYKPVELFNMWFPGDGKHSSSFVSAIEESVSGVFSATLKMSAFYGMWTWLIHTLFQVNIVFVPSFFAAIFAAVPLLMPYWAVFPAVLELWLIQGQWTKALVMLMAQMAPMSLVDAQIYSEIKGGGHPYLTGLAVAGGIFYFGFQGAIVGPVVLCSVFVAVKVGSSYMKEGKMKDSWSVGDFEYIRMLPKLIKSQQSMHADRPS